MADCTRFTDHLRIRFRGSLCVYCGEIATSSDHFPPASYSPWGYLLPACLECNGFASTHHPVDWICRVAIVKEKLRQKGKRFLSTPDWGEEEISELGRIMKGEVKRWQQTKERLERRLAWNAESYMASIDRDNVFAPQPVVSDFITNYGRLTLKSSEEQNVASDPADRMRQALDARFRNVSMKKIEVGYRRSKLRGPRKKAPKRIVFK